MLRLRTAEIAYKLYINRKHIQCTSRICSKVGGNTLTPFAQIHTPPCKGLALRIASRNLQLLMIEVYKTIQNLNPSFMKEIFVQKDMTYSLRNKLMMRIPKTQTSRHGIESLSFLGSKLWNNLPEELKNIKTLPSFKRQIKGWKVNCNCRLCREFVSQIGFIT